MSRKASIRIGFGLICAAAMIFQVILARIFAATLWYFFGAFAISLSLLGFALAGLVHHAFLASLSPGHKTRLLWKLALGFASLALLATASNLEADVSRFTELPWSWDLLRQLSFSFAAFLSAGLCTTLVLDLFQREIGDAYSIDLASGAVGALLGLSLLSEISAPGIVFLVAALAVAASVAFAHATLSLPSRISLAALSAACLGLFAANDRIGLLAMRSDLDAGPGVGTPALFQKWSPFGLVTVFGPFGAAPDRFLQIRTDGGQRSFLTEFDGDYERLRARPARSPGPATSLVHRLRSQGHALIIGAAGGTDVLAALKHGQERITAVEINPVTAYLARERFASFIGGIFSDPRVSFKVQDGRSFISRSQDLYDVIQLPRIDTQTGIASMFSETSLFTREALQEYLARLAPGGMLSITRTCELQDAPRLMNLLADQLERGGRKDLSRSFIVSIDRAGKSQVTTLIFKNGAFEDREFAIAAEAAKVGGFQLLYPPQLSDPELARNPCANLIRGLILSTDERDRVRSFASDRLDLDLSVPTDDRPFFFYSWRPSGLLTASPTEGRSRNDLIRLYFYLGNAFLLLLASAVFAYSALTRDAARDTGALSDRARRYGSWPMALYFAFVGLGYFFVEVALIQGLTVPFGHPGKAFALTVTGLLISSGIGARASERWTPSRGAVLSLTLLGILVAILLFTALAAFGPLRGWLGLDSPASVLFTSWTLLAPGFLMGTCFPLGIRLVAGSSPTAVPRACAVNNVFSVLGSTLALLICLNFGVRSLLLAGAMAYALSCAALAVEIRASR